MEFALSSRTVSGDRADFTQIIHQLNDYGIDNVAFWSDSIKDEDDKELVLRMCPRDDKETILATLTTTDIWSVVSQWFNNHAVLRLQLNMVGQPVLSPLYELPDGVITTSLERETIAKELMALGKSRIDA